MAAVPRSEEQSQTLAAALEPVSLDLPATLAQDDEAATDEDTDIVIDLLANDSDATGDGLTVVEINGRPVSEFTFPTVILPSGVSVFLDSDGSLLYAPNFSQAFPPVLPFNALGDGDEITDSFTYTIEDSEGARSEATVEVLVAGINDPPGPSGFFVSLGILEGESMTFDPASSRVTDPEGDPLTITALAGQPLEVGQSVLLPSGSLLTLNGARSVTLDTSGRFNDLALGESGSDNFSFTVSDGIAGEFTTSSFVSVFGVDGAPSADSTLSFAALSHRFVDFLDDGVLTFDEAELLGEGRYRIDNNFYALQGDGDGDLEEGEVAYKLADIWRGGRVFDLAEDGSDQAPVAVSAHGRIDRGEIGDLTQAVRLREDGLGLDNGLDGSGLAKYLNRGDSLSFDLLDEMLTRARFTAQTISEEGETSLLFDFDGDVVRTAEGEAFGQARRAEEVEDVVLRLDGIRDGDDIAIDFERSLFFVNGASRTDPDIEAFFTAFQASDQDSLTIGSRGGKAVALEELTLSFANPDEDPLPDPGNIG